jgi:tetratricopeptide (TPR) repeat protein
MSRAGRQHNERLSAIIKACGWSYDACARAIRVVAKESGDDLPSLHRSHVAHWISGVRPSGLTPQYLVEAASRRLGRQVTLSDLGLDDSDGGETAQADLDWERDPVADLVTVGRADLERRDFAKTALYSLAALAVPLDDWQEIAERGKRARTRYGAMVGKGEVEAVRHMTATFSQADERYGGGHARLAMVAYLTSDVAGYLRGSFTSDDDRRALFSAAAELTYLVGWKAFDSAQHGVAQRYYLNALRLANEADDGPLGGFILRAMAHQAVDQGHGQACLRLADTALEWSRKNGTPGASALFTVVKARGYAATRQAAPTVTTLRTAEQLLSRVDWNVEPIWIHRMGFGEPSLANQTAQALRDLGDLEEAERQFRRSTATRDGTAHRRIHALTLANLADVQYTRGQVPDACKNWSKSLDAMTGLQSARARQAVLNLRRRLASLGPRQPAFARQLDQRAAGLLSPTGQAEHA